MKFSRQVFLALAFTLTPTGGVKPQSSPSPDNTSEQAAQAQISASGVAPSPSATAAVEPPSLIPDNLLSAPATLPSIPAAPDLGQLSTFFKQTSLGKTADEHRLHVQMSALEVGIRNDEDLHALKADAFRARTDLERRHRLRTYYDAYYKRLQDRASTPDLKGYIVAQRAAHELTLLQPRTRHQTDEA
ncbi:MAG TPA: hypothetical protein VGF73_01315, partial [Chthoniobacterales bacterium]